MSDAILSDSDESILLEKHNRNESEIKGIYESDTATDFNFLQVPSVCYDATEDSATQNEYFPNFNADIGFKFNAHRLSQSISNSCDLGDDQLKRNSLEGTRIISKKNKTMLKEKERLQVRQQVLVRGKALKTIAPKKSKDMKPGECLKFIEVNLDRNINASFTFEAEIKNILQNANIKCNITDELIPNSITWRKNIEKNYNDEDKISIEKNVQTKEYVIVIWSNYETVIHVAKGTFCASILDIKALTSNYKIILVIFGMEKYFAYQKKRKLNESSRNKEMRCNSKINRQFDTLPIISKQQLEMCLTEIQIVAKCSNRLIENVQDLGLMIYQYTKSISEIPYKLQKKESQKSKFDYVMKDNKNTVHVDRDGNGLKRLWQQQLCQFNLSSLETAEAICTVYSSPTQLIKAYRSCTPDKGINLLKDIPIRRAAGPLTAARKIGPELSKKIYTMFTSQDGDILLGTEE